MSRSRLLPRPVQKQGRRVAGALVCLAVALALIHPVAPSAATPGQSSPSDAAAAGTSSSADGAQVTAKRTKRTSRAARRDRARCPRGHLAITIDGGPRPDVTIPMVQALLAEGVPATFFMTGRQVDKHPAVAAWVAANGFTVANHSYRHLDMRHMSRAEIDRELDATRDALRRAGISPSRYFRFPLGSRSAAVQRYVRSRGYTIAGWNIPSKDLRSTSTREIVQRVTGHLQRTRQRSNILLLHDSRKRSSLTVAAIPHIVHRALTMGFCISPLRDNRGTLVFAETGPGPYADRAGGLR